MSIGLIHERCRSISELLEITFRNEEEGVLSDVPKCTKSSVKVVKALRLKSSKFKKATEYAKKGKIIFYCNFKFLSQYAI